MAYHDHYLRFNSANKTRIGTFGFAEHQVLVDKSAVSRMYLLVRLYNSLDTFEQGVGREV